MKISKLNKIYFLILSTSIFVGFYFGEDSSGSGGFIADFKNTLPYIDNLNISLKNYFQEGVVHFPLHYYIESKILFLFKDLDLLRFVYCIISLSVPLLFYNCLKIKFQNIDTNNLFLFSLIIFLMPSFRSGAIWANSQLTAVIFFLIALFFYCKWEKNIQHSKFNIDLFLQILFMSLAVYSRQLYAFIFLYLVFIYYRKLNLKLFVFTCSIIFLFSLPGLYFVSLLPNTLTLTFTSQLQNSILVNLSILSFYLIPIYFILIFFKKFRLDSFRNNHYIFISFLFIILLFLTFSFDYNYKLGGGFFIKLSIILLDNLLLFYLTSFLGLFFCFCLCIENKENILILLLLIVGMTSYQIFQKYFEPMFFLTVFLIMQNKINQIFLNNKKFIYLLGSYFLIYLTSAILNDVFRITKSL
tara:strand:- start:188 stop:1426 length:1239 start_codon:yes stop_codon:yes gene_type:complete